MHEKEDQIQNILTKLKNLDLCSTTRQNSEIDENTTGNLSQIHVIMADYLQHFDDLEKRTNYRLEILEKSLQPPPPFTDLSTKKKKYNQRNLP